MSETSRARLEYGDEATAYKVAEVAEYLFQEVIVSEGPGYEVVKDGDRWVVRSVSPDRSARHGLLRAASALEKEGEVNEAKTWLEENLSPGGR